MMLLFLLAVFFFLSGFFGFGALKTGKFKREFSVIDAEIVIANIFTHAEEWDATE